MQMPVGGPGEERGIESDVCIELGAYLVLIVVVLLIVIHNGNGYLVSDYPHVIGRGRTDDLLIPLAAFLSTLPTRSLQRSFVDDYRCIRCRVLVQVYMYRYKNRYATCHVDGLA